MNVKNATATAKLNIFYGTRGNPNAKYLIVGDAWTVGDKDKQTAFSGTSGTLVEKFLKTAEISLEDCLFTTVFNAYPHRGDLASFIMGPKESGERYRFKNLWLTANAKNSLDMFYALIETVNPEYIIAMGDFALWALTDNLVDFKKVAYGKTLPTGIGKWRGSQLYTILTDAPTGTVSRHKLLPTYSPTSVFKVPAYWGLVSHDLTKRLKASWETPEVNFITEPSFGSVVLTLGHLQTSLENALETDRTVKLAVDIETRNNHIACVGLAWSRTEAICIPFISAEGNYWSNREEYLIVKNLREILTHPRLHLIGQNFSFDAFIFFHDFLCIPRISDDTLVKHHVIFPGGGDPIKGQGPKGIPQKGLHHLASLYNDHYIYWKDEGKTWEKGMNEKQLWEYNCKDCVATFEVAEKQEELFINEPQLKELYELQLEQLNEIALPIMLRGFKINKKRRTEMAEQLLRLRADLEKRLERIVPPTLLPRKKNAAPWYRSPTQLKEFFTEVLRYRLKSTGRNDLQLLAESEPILKPLVSLLARYRSIGVFYSTFTQAVLTPNNRFRSSVNIAGTDTFRWSTGKNPFGEGGNLQNIPKGDSAGLPNIKEFFIPDEGMVMYDADLSGADAQVVAAEANDQELLSKLKSGVKIHAETAKEFLGLNELPVSGEPHYDAFKRRIHATNYHSSAKTIYNTLLGLYGPKYTSLQMEVEFQNYWFRVHPKIREWHHRVKQSLEQTGGVRNKFGYRIIYFDETDKDFTRALAWIPQSTVAALTIRGMRLLKLLYPKVQILSQVHDSIVFQFPADDDFPNIDTVASQLSSMVVPYTPELRIPWNIGMSDTEWAECG